MPRLSRKSKITLLSAVLLLASAGLVVFSLYLLGLDREIRGQFAGARWALPAQVFATPLELYPGLALPSADLQHELERLGYRQTPALAGPGTFAPRKDGIDIDVRAFQFWDAAQPELKLAVDTDKLQITKVHDVEAGAPRQIVRIDPMLIGSIYPTQGEDRVLVRLDQVPALLPAGLIAVEDKGFRSHFGVSAKAIMRATFANLRAGHVVQGGSTITQQLVKNFFLDSEQTWNRKINEAFMALLLEAHYSKDEILEAYINEVHLGQDGNRSVNGFGLGSQFYFNKPLGELRAHEIALLVGLVKGPSFYNPRRHPERAKERRDVVLGVFHEEELLSDADYQAALAEPVVVAGSNGGGGDRYPAFVELVKRQLRGQYRDEDLTNEGLRIFTTLEPRAQEAMEKRIIEGLPPLEQLKKLPENSLEAAGVMTSVEGGDVLAVVGGRDTRYAGFNRALDARRSIGSLAKPFVYLTALMRPDQYHLHTILQDQPIDMKMPTGETWSPRNYDKELHGPTPLYMALAQSYNLPTVGLGLQLGEKEMLKTLRAAGYTGTADPLPSLFLGAVDIQPIEVAQMFATLAAGGSQSPLSSIREVQTKEGAPLSRFPMKVRQMLPEGPVYLLNWALQQVMIFGTGRSAYSVLPPSTVVAGKTGTTDDYRDSWFAGFGDDRVAVIWVGRDDNQPTGLSGAAGALPIWAKVMKDVRVRSFEPVPPSDIAEQLTDPATGLRADEGCPNAISMPFMAGYAPQEYAPCAQDAHRGPLDWLRDVFKN
jgi:penicillin-binding protein 1B